jgi:hypothetical protein
MLIPLILVLFVILSIVSGLYFGGVIGGGETEAEAETTVEETEAPEETTTTTTPLSTTTTPSLPTRRSLISNDADNNTLQANEMLVSSNRKFILKLESSGNLCIYNSDDLTKPIWETKTTSTRKPWLKMYPDGNVVLYDGPDIDNKILWKTDTFLMGVPPYKFSILNDGNLTTQDQANWLWDRYSGNHAWTLTRDSDHWGYDISCLTLDGNTTLTNCAKLCQADPNCTHYNLYNAGKNCCAKKVAASKTQYDSNAGTLIWKKNNLIPVDWNKTDI